MTRDSAFDPDRTAVWMANYDGACRFSQYGIGYADLFRRMGLPQIPVIAPLTSPRFDEFAGLFGLRFVSLLWEGWTAAEVLERLRLHTRPYETTPGETDRVFEAAMQDVVMAVTETNGKPAWSNRNVLAALKQGVKRMQAIPVDRSERRTVIGIVGEFYTVLNRWANHDIIRTLEELGAEVAIHGLTVTNCYTLFSQHYLAKNRLKDGRPGAALYYFLRNRWLMSCVGRMEKQMPEALRPFGTLDARSILDEVAPFIYYDIDPILATFTTRVRRFATSGVSGICNLFVLNCMLGNVMVSIFKNALRDYENLPVLHAVYDAQQETNLLTRIEAFMHQANLYNERSR
jgi:predicted nucleotide-binding protein (sugar kinase/HSP70/actin superfamily)